MMIRLASLPALSVVLVPLVTVLAASLLAAGIVLKETPYELTLDHTWS